mgnify:CR=1 FL=1
MAMDIKEIMSIIPHRQPFLLIDRVEEIVEGESVTAIKNVTYNEPFFAGHFPNEPVMPGVLIVEAMAQAGAVAILSMDEFKGKTAYFGGKSMAQIHCNFFSYSLCHGLKLKSKSSKRMQVLVRELLM